MRLFFNCMKQFEYKGNKSNYKLVKDLGSGGQGTVFKCKDLENNYYAIKIFSRFKKQGKQITEFNVEDENRFINECIALKRYDHKNIIKVIDNGNFLFHGKNIKFFVMELAKENCNLEKYVKNNAFQNDPTEIWRIIKEILNGLIYVNDKEGTFHRDLKPDNILVKNDGTIAITDFGLAKFPEKLKIKPVNSNVEMHNSRYYAPEQKKVAQGIKIVVDERCDIFALGHIIHELITGDIIRSTGNLDIYKINNKFGGKLNWILKKMTEDNVENRYASYKDVKKDLEEYIVIRGEDSLIIDKLTEDISKNLESLDKEKGLSLKSTINDYYNYNYKFKLKDVARNLYDILSWYSSLEKDWFQNFKIIPKPSQEILTPILTQINDCKDYFKQIFSENIEIKINNFDKKIQEFLEAFSKLTVPNSNDLEALDSFIKKDIIDQNVINSLSILLIRPFNSHYFFTNLTSEGWFHQLKNSGYFNKPTVFKVEGNIEMHFWPQINYLRNISSKISEQVLTLIKSYGGSLNYVLNRGFLDCILRIPISFSKKSIDFIREMFNYYYSSWELEILIELISKSINENEKEFSYQLFEIIFPIKKPQLESKSHSTWDSVHNWYYHLFSRKREFLNDFIEFDETLGERKYLNYLIDTLSTFLNEQYSINGDLNAVYPYSIRKSLLEQAHNYDYDIPNLLINEIIYYLDFNASELRILHYRKLLTKNWTIFIRIAFILLIKYSSEFQSEINNLLINDKYFLNDSLKIEINILLHNNYDTLNEANKQKVNDLILNGPLEQFYFYKKEDFSTEIEYNFWKEQKKRSWILDKIKVIDRHNIHPKLEEYFLKNQHFEDLTKSIRITKSETNYQNNLLINLSTEELIEYLSKEMSYNKTLASDLKRRIKLDPIKDENVFLKIKDIPRFYFGSIFSGLEEHLIYQEITDFFKFIPLLNSIFLILPNEEILLNEIELWCSINQIIQRILESKFETLFEEKLEVLYKNIKILLDNLTSETKIEEYKNNYNQALSFVRSSLLGQSSWTFFEIIEKRLIFISKNENRKQIIIKDIQNYCNKFSSSLIFNSVVASYFEVIYKINCRWVQEISIRIFDKNNLIKYRAVWECFFLHSFSSFHNMYIIMRSHYELLIQNIKDLDIYYDAINNFSMLILFEYIIYNDQLIFDFIEIKNSDLISNIMRLSLHVHKTKSQSIEEVNRKIDLWEYIFNDEEIEKLAYKEKCKIYSWYSSHFENSESNVRLLYILNKMLDKTKGKIRTAHSIFKKLFDYIGKNNTLIINIISKILGSSSKNDIFSFSFVTIKELLLKLNIEDSSELKRIIEYSIQRGDTTIRDTFQSKINYIEE